MQYKLQTPSEKKKEVNFDLCSPSAMWATVFQFVYRWLESAEVEFLLSLYSEWRLTLWLTAGWQSSSRTPKAFGLPVFLAFFMMLMPQSALLSSGCTHMRTHGHIFTMLVLISKWKKKNHIDTENRWFNITIMLPLSDI